jgi:flagellar assembly protein FliH
MRSLSNLQKTGRIIRLAGQAPLSGPVTIGPRHLTHGDGKAEPAGKTPMELTEPVRRLADSILAEARQKARRLEEESRQQLARWREQEEAVLARLREEAREQGYQTGWEQGLAEGYRAGAARAEEEWQDRLREINELLRHATQIKEQMIQEAEHDVLLLCLAIVRKVLGQLAEQQEETARQLIRQAFRENRLQGRVRLVVHPSDLPAVETLRHDLSALLEGERLIEIAVDPEVASPGCVIYTEHGTIEATLDAQLATIREQLMALWEKRISHEYSPVEVY